MHILDGRKHPLISFWAQPHLGGRVSLPGASLARAFLETRAFGFENGVFRIPHFWDVKRSVPNLVMAQDVFYAYLIVRGGTLIMGDE